MKQNTKMVALRKKLNLTQKDVAGRAGISRAYYANIEAGRRISTIPVAKRIALALSTTVDYLFADEVPNGNETDNTA